MKPRLAWVVVFPGSNGERDLAQALRACGFEVQLHAAEKSLPDPSSSEAFLHLIAFPGGFSYGDFWRAGTLAKSAASVRSLPAWIKHGSLVIGICNGMQVLLEAGFLPGGLLTNHPPGFVHRVISVEKNPNNRSVWLQDVPARLQLPIAHGVGNWQPPAVKPPAEQIAFRYESNINGSHDAVAGLTNANGQVLGLMPHPERWLGREKAGFMGKSLFSAAMRYTQSLPL